MFKPLFSNLPQLIPLPRLKVNSRLGYIPIWGNGISWGENGPRESSFQLWREIDVTQVQSLPLEKSAFGLVLISLYAEGWVSILPLGDRNITFDDLFWLSAGCGIWMIFEFGTENIYELKYSGLHSLKRGPGVSNSRNDPSVWLWDSDSTRRADRSYRWDISTSGKIWN